MVHMGDAGRDGPPYGFLRTDRLRKETSVMSDVSYRNFTGSAAENYERYFVPAYARPVADALLAAAELQPGERVLDVACGTGIVARQAAEKVGSSGSVTAVDLAPDMIDVAKSLPAPTGAHIEWHVADAEALPLDDSSFDVVLSQMGLQFMGDKAKAVAELGRVLAPGGRILINTPGAIQPVFEILEKAIIDRISPDLAGFVRAVFSMHDPEEHASLLKKAGLKEISSSASIVGLRLPPPADLLWEYVNLTPMAPFVAQAPKSAQEALERQVVEDLEPFVVNGKVPVDQPIVTATGRK
jgi:ubiquinone/menaquinone biosynthesis C-methylase UbiE